MLSGLVLLACDAPAANPPDAALDAALDAAPTDAAPIDAPFVCTTDADGDGEIDDQCSGGTDCDDDDFLIGATAVERCGNVLDDDCDDATDEAECEASAGSSCDAPLVIAASTTTSLRTVTSDVVGSPTGDGCSLLGRPDTRALGFVRIDLTAPSSVRVELPPDARGGPVAVFGSSCGAFDGASCAVGGSAFSPPRPLLVPRLEAGSHWLTVVSTEPAVVGMTVTIGAPVSAPPNDRCDTAAPLPGDGRASAVLALAEDDLTLGCAPPEASRDVVWTFTLDAPRDVRVTLTSRSGGSYAVSIRSVCDDPATELRCDVLGTASSIVRARNVPPGTYALIVEGAPAGDFDLDVAFLDPTAELAGERCESPIELAHGVLRDDTLVDRTQDVPGLACLGDGLRAGDVVYAFDLTETSDVDIELRAPSRAALHAEIRSACADASAFVGNCAELVSFDFAEGIVTRSRAFALPPGRYYAIVSANAPTGYTIAARIRPPVPVTPVTGNDRCETATTIPTTGGRFEGALVTEDYAWSRVSCRFLAEDNPDAAFRIDLPAPRTVTARVYERTASGLRQTEASLDLLGATCTEPDLLECNQNDGFHGTLPAGVTHLLVRRALFGAGGDERSYVLDVEVE